MRIRIGLLSLFALVAAATFFFREENRVSGILPVDPPTSYFQHPGSGERVLVVHGLNSSKQIMNEFSIALASAGFEVTSIDLPGHGAAPAGFEATVARRAVEQVLDRLGNDIIVIGHSLGAGLLLDLANDHDFKSMVLLSPPPTPVNRIRAERVLVFTGEYDLPRIHSFVPELEEGGARSVELRTATWAGHTGAVFRTDIIAQIIEWLGRDASNVRIGRRLLAIGVLFVWSIVTGILLLTGSPIASVNEDVSQLLIWYAATACMAILISAVAPVLGWLRLFATDYLMSVLFVAGIGLLLLRPKIRFEARAVMKACLVAAYVIAIPGLLVASHLIHLTLSDGRWWRFPVMAAATLPLFFVDEVFLRPLRPWWKAGLVAIATRLVIGALIITGALTVSRADAFLVLIVHLVVLFWVGLWFAAELVHRHTQNPLATAIFVSIVHAWVLAAMFITV